MSDINNEMSSFLEVKLEEAEDDVVVHNDSEQVSDAQVKQEDMEIVADAPQPTCCLLYTSPSPRDRG